MSYGPKSILLLVLIGLWLMAAGIGHARVPELLDQFGHPVGFEADAAQPQMVIVVTAKRLRRVKAWETALRKRFPWLPVLRVADVPRTAPITHEDVAARFRKRLPADVQVGIDLEGTWAAQYQLDVSRPNLLVFDRSGALVATHHGMYSQTLFSLVSEDIERAFERASERQEP